jgi:hypothetical protein
MLKGWVGAPAGTAGEAAYQLDDQERADPHAAPAPAEHGLDRRAFTRYTVIDNREPTSFPAWVLAALARIDGMRARNAALRPLFASGDNRPLERFVAASREGAACRAGRDAAALMAAARATGLPATEAKATIASRCAPPGALDDTSFPVSTLFGATAPDRRLSLSLLSLDSAAQPCHPVIYLAHDGDINSITELPKTPMCLATSGQMEHMWVVIIEVIGRGFRSEHEEIPGAWYLVCSAAGPAKAVPISNVIRACRSPRMHTICSGDAAHPPPAAAREPVRRRHLRRSRQAPTGSA